MARLDENAAAARLELSPEELAAIERVAPRGRVAGARYPESAMKTVNV